METTYQRALQLGIENMAVHPFGSPEYNLAQKMVAFAAERIREEQKVELVPPPEIGSIDEKIQHDTEQPNYYL